MTVLDKIFLRFISFHWYRDMYICNVYDDTALPQRTTLVTGHTFTKLLVRPRKLNLFLIGKKEKSCHKEHKYAMRYIFIHNCEWVANIVLWACRKHGSMHPSTCKKYLERLFRKLARNGRASPMNSLKSIGCLVWIYSNTKLQVIVQESASWTVMLFVVNNIYTNMHIWI